MRFNKISHQKELFGSSRIQELQERIHELDVSIAEALKTNRYDRAKVLSDEQKDIIQELVELGESESGPKK